jgi:hypothetical protein
LWRSETTFAKPVGFGDHQRLAIAGRNKFIEGGNSKVIPQVPLSDNAGVTNVAPTAYETDAGPMEASTKTQEEAAPMLDVHAPHESIHTWKGFFIHIAAIAFGLLLALALEKAVEYLHQRHLLSEARSELAAELENNRQALQKNVAGVQRIQQELEVDLKVIHALRSHALPDGKLDYSVNLYATFDGAWQSVHQNGALSLMPQKELTDDAWFYRLLLDLMNAEASLMPTMKIAGAMAASASSEPLDIHRLDELTSKTIEAQGQLDYLRMFLDIEEGGLKYFDKASMKDGTRQ